MAKMKPPELNAYRYGTLSAAEFAPSKKFPENPEVKLIGHWEGEGEGYWYANWKAVTALVVAGVVRQEPGDGKRFTAATGVRFCVYRQHGEGDAHDWFVAVYDSAGNVVDAPSAPSPVKPQAAVATSPQQEGPASGNPPPPPTQLSGHPVAPSTPPVAPANGEARKERERETVHKVDLMLGVSLAIASYWHVKVANAPLVDLDENAVQDSAAAVMIRLEHLGYDSTTDRTRTYLKRLARLQHSIDPNRCPLVGDDVKGNGKKAEPGTAKPKKEAQIPAPVSRIPGAESLSDVPAALDDEDDDLPF